MVKWLPHNRLQLTKGNSIAYVCLCKLGVELAERSAARNSPHSTKVKVHLIHEADTSYYSRMAPAPDESDLERDVEASASSPLLRPSAVPSRPSYRRRRISQSFPVPSAESYRSRWWVGVISGLIALLLAGIGVALVVVRSKRNNNPL